MAVTLLVIRTWVEPGSNLGPKLNLGLNLGQRTWLESGLNVGLNLGQRNLD